MEAVAKEAELVAVVPAREEGLGVPLSWEDIKIREDAR